MQDEMVYHNVAESIKRRQREKMMPISLMLSGRARKVSYRCDDGRRHSYPDVGKRQILLVAEASLEIWSKRKRTRKSGTPFHSIIRGPWAHLHRGPVRQREILVPVTPPEAYHACGGTAGLHEHTRKREWSNRGCGCSSSRRVVLRIVVRRRGGAVGLAVWRCRGGKLKVIQAAQAGPHAGIAICRGGGRGRA